MRKAYSPFSFFVAGQGVLSLGESVRFIAVTILICDITGSGVSAAVGAALSSLPVILLSPFAGALGDRSHEGSMLVLTDLARFIVTVFFLSAGTQGHIYMLLILSSLLDVFYNPSKTKFILNLTGREGAMKANSLMTGVYGAAYLTGPLLTGFLSDKYGHEPAIIVAAFCCLFSAMMTLLSMLMLKGGMGSTGKIKFMGTEGRNDGIMDFAQVLKYCRTDRRILKLLSIDAIVGFCTLSINLSFYPFAFDFLKVTAKGWSLIITIYYGTNLAAMLLMRLVAKRLKGTEMLYECLLLVSIIWLIYAFTRNFAFVLLMQFIEGTLLSACGIIIAAGFQRIVEKRYIARVSALNDLIISIGKLAGMGCMTVIMQGVSFYGVFIFCSIIMAVFVCICTWRS